MMSLELSWAFAWGSKIKPIVFAYDKNKEIFTSSVIIVMLVDNVW